MGSLINAGGIILGAIIGLLLKKGIPRHVNESITQVEGLAIMVIGLAGIISSMFTIDPATGELAGSGGLALLLCLVVGCLIGELLRINDRLEDFGRYMESKMNAKGFAKGFITASLLYCIGAMSIMGPLTEALEGNLEILLMKSILDGVTSIVLASSLGGGVAFAAVPVLLFQGVLTLLARWIEPYIAGTGLLEMICLVGYTMVLAIGVNFVCKTNIKTANLLPALVLAIPAYYLL